MADYIGQAQGIRHPDKLLRLLQLLAFQIGRDRSVSELGNQLSMGRFAEGYFWRTYDQQEIDLVEEHCGGLHGFEIKWSPKANTRAPRAWAKGYPHGSFDVVSPANYLEYIVGPAA